MTVWLLVQGEYAMRGVTGVFDSPGRAMAHVGGKWTRTIWTSYPNRPRRDKVTHRQTWDNGKGDSIYAEEIYAEGPTHETDKTILQALRPSGDYWDYLPISAEQADDILEGSSDQG
jgi:hypothetical protein